MVSVAPDSAVVPQRNPGDSAMSQSSSPRSASQINWSIGPVKLPRR